MPETLKITDRPVYESISMPPISMIRIGLILISDVPSGFATV